MAEIETKLTADFAKASEMLEARITKAQNMVSDRLEAVEVK